MCKNDAYCDFCDARCPYYVYEFTENGENFAEELLEWYDAGKPDSNIEIACGYLSPGRMILSEWEPVDTIRGEDRRWSVWIDKIYEVAGRYFMVGYDHGLTEMQEDEYWDTDVQEVKPEIVVKVEREWKVIEK